MGRNVNVAAGVLTTKSVKLVPVPLLVVIRILPVVAPVGTTARICEAESTVNIAAEMPLNDTAVTPVKLFPKMVTVVPLVPLVGVNEAIVGGANTVKSVLLVAVPVALVRLIFPLAAPAGTLTRIWLSESMTNPDAVTPLNLTLDTPIKLNPVIVTALPTVPLVGENELMLGGGLELPPVSKINSGSAGPSLEL
jgi:hypothetical protein